MASLALLGSHAYAAPRLGTGRLQSPPLAPGVSGRAPPRLASRLLGRSLRSPASCSPALGLATRRAPTSAVLEAPPPQQELRVYEVAELDRIYAERDACGVGLIASLKQEATHNIVEQGLTALGCMEHRGGCSADNDSGDGSGLMTAIPWELLDSWQAENGREPLDRSTTGVGMLFLPTEEEEIFKAKSLIQTVLEQEKVEVIGWRDVPVDEAVVGTYAKETMPRIQQLLIKVPGFASQEEVELELYIIRKLIEKAASRAAEGGEPSFYFCSLSSRTIVYKGMLRAAVVGAFFNDLKNPLYKTNFAVYHRRFSTNTTPKWPLAQPMRVLGHNGEINTLQGNLNWMVSREPTLSSPDFRGREADIFPVANVRASDSANLDGCAEMMVRSGRTMEETLMMLVPEAYQNHPTLLAKYPEVVSFYEYYKGQMEAWDGPALLVFSNGKTVGACLDRNGLRPARFWRTKDDILYVASEVGVLNTDEALIWSKGRLGPGMMISVDLETGEVLSNTDVKKKVANAHPFAQWLASESRTVLPQEFSSAPTLSAEELLQRQNAFGYSSEDVGLVIEAMASQGKEPTFCMGDDIPLPVLSGRPHLLFDYFKQRFAQVTNPPIDPLREGLVMSLEMSLGRRDNLLEVVKEHASLVRLSSPVLNEAELDELLADPKLAPVRVSTFYDIPEGTGGDGALKAGLDRLCAEAVAAVEGGAELIVLSDLATSLEVTKPAIPILLAVGAVHHHLIAKGLRLNASIVAETAQCFSTHHFACLVGYGASAVCAYGALETCRQWRASSKTEKLMTFGKIPSISMEKAQYNFKKAIEGGLLKILSKMGISLLSSYCGAQIFEAYGLGKDVIEYGFKGTVSRIGGLTLDELSKETVEFWKRGFPADSAKKLENAGFIQFIKGGEYHGNNPEMTKLLHKAVRTGEADAYNIYQKHVATRPTNVLRDLLELHSGREPIPIEDVEPATALVERFCTGGMSLGAISRECHEVIAIAMNRLGGKSNSGEGGEDPTRWTELEDVDEKGLSPTFPHLKGLQNGDKATSKIKQVASGRFGVTPTFLVNADQLEIKIAQGAKPGEGGQLPGKKVSPYIAQLRSSKPGVPLISPPPHHDIYSIEDLAQLIWDLHQVNPSAKVSVKLVAEAGIGTVASGVAKANADIIQVSGHDGGTGASPVSSIKHAGGPWELGLAETHKTLLANGLRDRVVIRADGGYKAGSDVLLGAAMGADEFGFGSLAMIATGCIMARICHTNNCPVGVASQREELRARFPGVPGDLVNFFLFIAEEVRAGLAQLGFSSLDEIVGRTDLLRPRPGVTLHKTESVDLSYLTEFPGLPALSSTERRQQEVHTNGRVLDDQILANPAVSAAIEAGKPVNLTTRIVNIDRATCGRIAGAIAKLHGEERFSGKVDITFVGSAGQSFGCFLTPGMFIKLIGEGNDYVGKGMAGGVIAVMPSETATFDAESSTIIGNTCLYGATGGKLFVRGLAGERFAVRNSAAEAVIEGAGDHCCEYMTGGVVVALGKVGRNVAAGMTGGIGYFLDEDGSFPPKVNTEIVTMQRVPSAAGEKQLKSLIQAHVESTGSVKGARILADWDSYFPRFWQLVPPSEALTPQASATADKEEAIPAMAA